MIAVEIRHCSQLREVSLEGNRLATPVIDLRALARLRSLQLYANPLEFLPELSPCTSLRHLSLANVGFPGSLLSFPPVTVRLTLCLKPAQTLVMQFSVLFCC